MFHFSFSLGMFHIDCVNDCNQFYVRHSENIFPFFAN